ncbi:MAG TPA: hypothetical protein VII36_06485, partial [Usitatibacter sp.]
MRGEDVVLSQIAIVPGKVAMAVGWNVAVIWQPDPGLYEPGPQVVVHVKAPLEQIRSSDVQLVSLMVLMVYGELPFEVIVIVRGGLSVPTATFPKSMPGGEIETDGTDPMVKTGDENSEVSTGVTGSCIRVASREKLSAVSLGTTTLPGVPTPAAETRRGVAVE